MRTIQNDESHSPRRARPSGGAYEAIAWRALGAATVAGLALAASALAACGGGGPDLLHMTTTGTGAATSTGGSTSTTSGGTGGSTSTSTSTSSSGASAGCHGTLTGAVSGSFDCSVTAAYDGTLSGLAIVSTVVPPNQGFTFVGGGGSVDGPLADQAYPFASFVKWGYTVVAPDLTVWGTSDGEPNGGTQSMTITSFVVTLSDDNSMTYDVHGTYDAVGPWINATPDPGTEVTAHITF